MKRTVLSILLAVLGAACLSAQTARITGIITDVSGAVMPGVEIAIVNADSGAARSTTSNDRGNYSVPYLPPGRYKITARAPGFKPLSRDGITLAVDQTARIDVVMELGEVSETVEVAGAAPLLHQETSALGQVIDNTKVVNIPINGRNPFKLLQLTTNVVSMPSSYGQFKDIPVNTQDDTAFSINGGRAYTNELLIDGIPATTGVSNQITTIPNVDSTQEFKVQSSNLSAEWGRFGGGVINVSTRSGTNAPHGSLYEFLRNSAFDANDFFNKRAGSSIPPFRLNQFGYAAGGPVVLPGVYHGKDRTFFFHDYQGTRWRRGNVYLQTVPTALQREGDFSRTFTQTGQQIVIYDPHTTRPNPASPGAFLRTPFPGNRIQRSQMDPVAQRLISFYPLANTPGDPWTEARNYVSNAGNGIDQAGTTTRIDHSITDAWKTFGRFSLNRTTLTFGDLYCPTNEYCNIASPTNGKVIVNNYSGGLDNTITLNPSTVLNVRYGFARYFWTRTGRGLGFDQRQVGMPEPLVSQFSIAYFPVAGVEGYGPLGGGSLVRKAEDTHSILGAVMKVSGKHNIKAGGDLRVRRPNYFALASGGGTYSFTRAMTRGPNPNVVTADAGVGAASLLLGTPSAGTVNFATGSAMQNFYFAGYIQDDIRVSSKLTVNLGLRYETESPYSERYNQLSWFDFALPSPVRNAAFPNLAGGLVFAGPERRTVYDWDTNNFAPRAGFAYTIANSTVFRGGGGIFYMPLSTTDRVDGFSPNSGFSSSTPMVATLDGLTPFRYLRDPFPEGLVKPVGNTLGAGTFLGQGFSFWQVGARTPYMVQWNADVQHAVGQSLLFDVAYSASRGVKLNQSRQFNALAPQYLALGAGLQTLVDNPFYPSITAGALGQPRVQRRQLLLPYPQYTGVTHENDGSGGSTYHSLAFKIEKRASRGLAFLFAYTLSKLITDVRNQQNFDGANPAYFNPSVQNWYDLRSERSVSESDIPQSVSLSYVLELPFGPKRRFLNTPGGLAGKLLGGWQLSGFYAYRSGFPLVMTATVPNGGNRPNSTGRSAALGGGRSRNDQVNQWFDVSAFTQPAPFTFGNVGRTLPDVRGPSLSNWDMSLMKDTVIAEKWTLQFRAESFNLLNRPHFAQPNTALANVQFGIIGNTAQLPRVNQLALKLLF